MSTITLPQIFQSGMVLQRHKPICVWGTAEGCDTVTVTFAGEIALAKVRGGHWKLFLPSMEATHGLTLTVEAMDVRVIYTDIAIGEVWIASGQSNMEFLLKYDAEQAQAIRESDADLRCFEVPKLSYVGQDKVEDHTHEGLWRKAVGTECLRFSAVGYYFGRKLRERLGVPVGIVSCNWGGISASCMTARENLTGDLAVYLDEADAVQRGMDEAIHLPLFQQMQKEFQEVYIQRVPDMGVVIDAPIAPDADTMTFMQKLMSYHLSAWSAFRPCGLYDTMLRTIAPYTVTGVIWYQGESDAARAELYGRLFAAMVKSWRDLWHEELPFIQVQLASYACMMEPIDFVPIRAVQEQLTRDLPGVSLACAMDVGLPYDIHPKQKRPVGERLAYQALGKVYGQYVLADSPTLGYRTKTNGLVDLEFKHCGYALTLEGDLRDALELKVNGETVQEYTFTLERNHLRIHSDAITPEASVNVRFAWKPYCTDPVYNSNGLPMLPFNTDV